MKLYLIQTPIQHAQLANFSFFYLQVMILGKYLGRHQSKESILLGFKIYSVRRPALQIHRIYLRSITREVVLCSAAFHLVAQMLSQLTHRKVVIDRSHMEMILERSRLVEQDLLFYSYLRSQVFYTVEHKFGETTFVYRCSLVQGVP